VADLLTQRLHNQKLTQSDIRTASDVVKCLGAVQAQDFPAAKWGLGIRAKGLTDHDAEDAFNSGASIRTHILRPTWHFVAPDDLRWMLKLSAPRVHQANAYYYRQTGFDEKTVKRACAMIQRSLEGGTHLTRAELGTHLKRAKVLADGLKLAYIVMRAELDGVICSGPRKGKQFTYALIDERLPKKTRQLDGDQALAELATRYFNSHGPATIRDFVWWSGMTVKDARTGIAAAGRALVETTIDNKICYSTGLLKVSAPKSPCVYLLPNFDEFLVAYKDRGVDVDMSGTASQEARTNGGFAHHLIIDGRLAGGWRRTLKGHVVAIEVAPFKPLTVPQKNAVAAAADRYGDFLNQRAELVVV
jgi:hypothetical protein